MKESMYIYIYIYIYRQIDGGGGGGHGKSTRTCLGQQFFMIHLETCLVPSLNDVMALWKIKLNT